MYFAPPRKYTVQPQVAATPPCSTDHIPYGNQTPYSIPDGPDVLTDPILRRNEIQGDSSLKEVQFNHMDFRESLDKLSNGAAPGPDGIPARMLKAAKNTISVLLNDIFKCSYESGDIPAILNLAHIIPIHKGKSWSEPSNFRPISLTSHNVKTFERVLRKTLVNFLEFNKKMDHNQHGSRSGRCTLSQLLDQQDEVLKALEEGENLDTIYLDFSKAFDKCDHGIIFHKLKSKEK